MAQTLTTQEVKKMIDDAVFGVKNDIGTVKVNLTKLTTKVDKLVKSTKASELVAIVKEFDGIKTQVNKLDGLIGAIDMNDINIVVDAKSDTIGFAIGEFEFNSTIKVVD